MVETETCLSDFYKKISPVFTETKKLLQLVLTFPITSNEAERGFSKLKVLLAPLRSTMKEKRLNNQAIMSTHKNRLDKLSTDSIIKKFKASPRHALLIKPNSKVLEKGDSSSDDSDQGSFYLSFFSFTIPYINQNLILLTLWSDYSMPKIMVYKLSWTCRFHTFC